MVATEKLLRAFLHVIYHVTLFVRIRSGGSHRLSDTHLFDLMNAIHNVPGFLTNPAGFFTAEILKDDYFAPYDEKWGNEGIGLVDFSTRV